MILGFLGKGGSGKSSVATQMALFLHAKGKRVLAIDADHNMDLSYNLNKGLLPTLSYLGDSLPDIKEYLDMKADEKYDRFFMRDELRFFSFNQPDAITQKYSTELKKDLHLMAAGPQTDVVLHGKSCSHILTTPLKMYLPLLELTDSEIVVLDEKAGADGVTTGIVTGIDVGIIVVEPAIHSLKTGLQIASLMDFYQTPYVFVGNKINSENDWHFINTELNLANTIFLPTSKTISQTIGEHEAEWDLPLNEIVLLAANLKQNNRLKRTQEKFQRNLAFSDH